MLSMKMKSPELVLWDLDGTLIESEPLHQESMRRAYLGLGQAAESAPGALPGLGAAANYRHVFALDPAQPMPQQFAAWYSAVVDHFVANLSATSPLAASLECCAWFAARGLAQSVVSNAHPRIIEASLRHLGIREHIRHVCSGDDVARGKPAPDAYLHALALHGASADSCIAFEDSRVGITAAKAAGLAVVAVTDSAELAALADFSVSPSQPESWYALRQHLF